MIPLSEADCLLFQGWYPKPRHRHVCTRTSNSLAADWCIPNTFIVCSCRQQDLYRILKAYTIYRPDEGYCQAQAPVAAVLLMHMPAEVRGGSISVRTQWSNEKV